MIALLKQVEQAYVVAFDANATANPGKIVPLIDAFMALWNLAQGVPPAVEQDLMQDLMPVLGGPTTLVTAAAALRADLVNGAIQYNVAGAGRAVMRALIYLSTSDYVTQSDVTTACGPFSAAFDLICNTGV